MRSKGLLNPNNIENRSRSRTRGMQGRQFGKIKAGKTAAMSDSKVSGSKSTRSASPIIDMSSLQRSMSRGRRPQRSAAAGETTFTKTTAGSSDDNDDRYLERRSKSRGGRSVSRSRKVDSAVGGNKAAAVEQPKRRAISRGRRKTAEAFTPDNHSSSNKVGTVTGSIKSGSSNNSDDGPAASSNLRPRSSRIIDAASSVRSNSSNNTGNLSHVKEGAIVPFQQSSTASSAAPQDDPQVKRCPHHPSVILQEKIHQRWLILHADCPRCVEEEARNIAGGGKRENNSSGKRRKSIKRGLMKFGRRRNHDSPDNTSRCSRSNSPKRRSRSPFMRFRRVKNRAGRHPSSDGGSMDGSNDGRSRSPSPHHNNRSRSNSLGGSSRTSNSTPFRRRRRRRSRSPENHSFDGSLPRSNRPSTPPEDNNNSIGNLHNSETAIVLRERTPSPDSNSVELNPNRVGARPSSPGSVDSFGRSRRRVSSPDDNSITARRMTHRGGHGPRRRSSMGGDRPIHNRGGMSRGRDGSSRSSSPNSINGPSGGRDSSFPRSNRRRGSMGRPTSRQRPRNRRNMSRGRDSSRSPSLDSLNRRPRQRSLSQRGGMSRGRGSRPSSPNSMDRPPRGVSWSRSRSPSMGRRNQRRGPAGRSISRPRPPNQRNLSRGRGSSRSISPNSLGRPRSSWSRSRHGGMSRGSRSNSPQNSMDGPPRRRSLTQRKGPSVGRPSNERPRRPMRRKSRSSYNSRSRSPYNSIGSRSRSPSSYSPYDSRSVGSRGSRGSNSMESSNADYFDDEHGEVVLHTKGDSRRRPSVVSRRVESLDESFNISPPRRRNSFGESFDRLPPGRRLVQRRANSFDDSFDNVLPTDRSRQYTGRRNSLEDTLGRSSYRPYDSMAYNSSFHRDSSFDRMRERIATSRRDNLVTDRTSLQYSGSTGNKAEGNSSRSVGTEWSDYSNVKSKSSNLSAILRDINKNIKKAGRNTGADRSAVSPRRNTVAMDRSLSPLPRIHHRALSVQSQSKSSRKTRSSSVGPSPRSKARSGNDSSQVSGKSRSQIDLAHIMNALASVRASSNVTPQSNALKSVDDHASRASSHGAPAIRANKSMQELNQSSFPRVQSENSFTALDRQQPQQHQYSKPSSLIFDGRQRYSPGPPPQMHQNALPTQELSRPVCSPLQPPPPPPRPPVKPPEDLPPLQQQDHSRLSQAPPSENDWRKYQLNNHQINEQPPPGTEDDWRRYQQSQAQKQQQPSNDDDWRKYQVGARKSPSNQHNPPNDLYSSEEPQRSQSARRGGGPDEGSFDNVHHGQGNADWLTYQVASKSDKNDLDGGRSVSSGKRGRSKMFGKAPEKLTTEERHAGKTVKKMPFTDQFGDFGLYTGQVDEESRPHGKGSMKYDNGVFYEGTWTNGCQDQKAASQYGRIRGGFTSWQGQGRHATKSGMVMPWNARKNDTHDPNAKTNVRGMEWTDLNGDSGRYTGEVNAGKLPHGFGIMKYDFGLIAEGDWNNGILKEGPQDRMISAAASMMSGARSGGMSVGPGGIGPGMSIGPGTRGFSSASVGPMSVGPMSVGGSNFGGSFMGGAMPMMYPQGIQVGGMNPMMMNRGMPLNAQQHMMIAQQNAAMKSMGGSVYGGGSVVYGGGPLPMPMQQCIPPQMLQQVPPMQMQGAPPPENRDVPPISEIKIPP